MPDMITANVEQVTQLALPTSLDKAIDQTKRFLIRKSYHIQIVQKSRERP
ncbi:hypothetical protein [Fictibacillus sp. NRS-1165]